MSSFKLNISPQDEVALDLALDVNRALNAAFARREKSGMTKTKLAAKIGTNKSSITRILGQASNLTLETLGNVSWALDHVVKIQMIPIEVAYANRNSVSHFVNVVSDIEQIENRTEVVSFGAGGSDKARVLKPEFARGNV